MLLFELFPAFVALVSVGVAVGLYMLNRRSRHDPPDPVVNVNRPPPGTPPAKPAGRRPSMSA